MRNKLLGERRPNSDTRLAERLFAVPIIGARQAAVLLRVSAVC